MNTKTVKDTPASGAFAAAATPWNLLADFGRQQMSVATDASSAIFRGFEAMRKVQQQAAHNAAVRHEAVAQRLHGDCAPADLLAIQSELLSGDLKGASQYWQEIGAAVMEMQTEIMGFASHLVDSETALEAASALESLEGLPGVNGFFTKKMSAPTRTRTH